METPKWKTTIMGVLGVLLMALNIWKPDFFDSETNAGIVNAVNAIITAVLSIIAIFSARDELKSSNAS